MHSSALKAFRLEMYKTHQCKTRRCEQQPCFWFTCHCLQSLSCYQNMDGSGCRDCSSFSNKSPTGSESYPGKVEEAGVWDSWIQCYWGDTAGKRLGFGLAFFFSFLQMFDHRALLSVTDKWHFPNEAAEHPRKRVKLDASTWTAENNSQTSEEKPRVCVLVSCALT